MRAYRLTFDQLLQCNPSLPAGSLPTFMPGYEAGSQHIHTTHAIAAVIGAVILFVLGLFASRARA